MKPLFLPLKAAFFDAFVDGSKTIEYRLYGARWNEGTCKVGRPVLLSRGYGKRSRRWGQIEEFYTSHDVTESSAFRSCYPFAMEGAVAACIKIKLTGDFRSPCGDEQR